MKKNNKMPWERPDPTKTDRKLTPGQRAQARSRARAAGRPYPNLVDNMAVAKTSKKRKAK